MELLTRDTILEIASHLDTKAYVRWATVFRGALQALPTLPRHHSNAIVGDALYRAHRRKENLFFVGSAGTGKSHALYLLYERLTSNGIKVATVCPTGVSASNFPAKARTIHSFFGVKPEWQDTTSVKVPLRVAERLQKVTVLLIDEISMVSASLLSIMDRVAQIARGSLAPMGGLQVIVAGDFFQLAPVSGAYAFRSHLWDALRLGVVKLPISHRHMGDLAYYNLLQRVRVGKPLPSDVTALSRTRSAESSTLRLFTTNNTVDEYNRGTFDALPGEVVHVSTAQDTVVERTTEGYTPTHRMSTTDAAKRAFTMLHKYPKVLAFKVGAQYIITQNIDVEHGVANGTQCVLLRMDRGDAIVKTHAGKTVRVRMANVRIKVQDASRGYAALYLERTQYPLRLGYAMTIHASQGLTLTAVAVNLDRTFSNHQVYVALSRMKTLRGLSLASFDPKCITVSDQVVAFYRALGIE